MADDLAMSPEDAAELEKMLPQIGQGEFVPPAFRAKAFHCPRCGVYTPQVWGQLVPADEVAYPTPVWRAVCTNCRKASWWFSAPNGARMFEPEQTDLAPPPHAELPDDVRSDYEEARAIVARSPRGAAALLRLAVQKLCKDLGGSGDNLNEDIGALIRNGLDPRVADALDALRVIGNSAVHPGELDLRDDRETAVSLFGWLNFIVEHQVSRPKALERLVAKLPAAARAAIAKRDGKS